MALGLLTASLGTGGGFLYVNFFFYLNFEVSISLFVSMSAHSSWPWACSQPLLVPRVVIDDRWRTKFVV
jgi:hypothetical protein